METSKTDSIQHKQKSYHKAEAPRLIKNLSFPFSFLGDFHAWPDSFQEISLPFNWNLLLIQLRQTTLMQPWAFSATQKQTPVSWHGQIPCFSAGLWILSCTNGRWRVNDLLCCAFIFNQRQPCDCWLQSLVSSNWDDLIFFCPCALRPNMLAIKKVDRMPGDWMLTVTLPLLECWRLMPLVDIGIPLIPQSLPCTFTLSKKIVQFLLPFIRGRDEESLESF